MAISLSQVFRTDNVVVRFIDNTAVLTPPLGGPSQRITRNGSRYAADISIPSLSEACARTLIAAQLRSRTEGLPLSIPVPRPPQGVLPAAARVNGAAQVGALLAIDGLGAGEVVPALQPFNLTSGGRAYLHMTTSAVTASGGGAVNLTIAPRLRFSPADNALLNFATPVLEGYLPPDSTDWELQALLAYGVAFTITENE